MPSKGVVSPCSRGGPRLTGAAKSGPGTVGKPIVFAGAAVRPGDWLVGDADGVVVVPREKLDACCQRATERVAKESVVLQQLEAGAKTLELLGLDPAPIEVAAEPDNPSGWLDR